MHTNDTTRAWYFEGMTQFRNLDTGKESTPRRVWGVKKKKSEFTSKIGRKEDLESEKECAQLDIYLLSPRVYIN